MVVNGRNFRTKIVDRTNSETRPPEDRSARNGLLFGNPPCPTSDLFLLPFRTARVLTVPEFGAVSERELPS